MKITITGDPEPEALGKACVRALHIMGMKCIVDIDCPARDQQHPAGAGWLEYGMSFKNVSGDRTLYVAMIQRHVGAEYEFHS